MSPPWFRDLAAIRRCAKTHIDWFTESLCYFFSTRLVSLVAPTRVTPDMLTGASLALALAGCGALLGAGHWPLYALAGTLFFAAYVLDCADGQLARYKGVSSPLGWRLDLYADRAKEALVVACLSAVVAGQGDGERAWVAGLSVIGLSGLIKYVNAQEMAAGGSLLPPGTVSTGCPGVVDWMLLQIRRVERLRDRYNLSLFDVGDFHLVLVLGLWAGSPRSVLYLFLPFALLRTGSCLFRVFGRALHLSRLAGLVYGQGYDVIVFGAGRAGEFLIRQLNGRGDMPALVADNDRAKWGGRLLGLEIVDPARLPELVGAEDRRLVLIASVWHADIERQLLAAGVDGRLIGVV